GDRMRRREFITLIGVTTWPMTARAQQKPVIGFLNSGSPDAYPDRVIAFHQGLRQLGYIEGENVVVDYRWALGEYDRLPAFAAERAESRRHWLPNRRPRRYRSSSRSAATQSSSAWSPHIIGRVETRQAQTSWLPKWMVSVLP